VLTEEAVVKRRKKRVAEPPTPAAPARFAARPFEDALGQLKRDLQGTPASAASPAPAAAPPTPKRAPAVEAPDLSEEDRDALGMAMVGVEPLPKGGAGRVTRSAPAASRTQAVAAHVEDAEDRARSRLDALVAGGVSFRIEWNEEHVTGLRVGADPRVFKALRRRHGADDSLDLHGLHGREASREVTRFVRQAYRRGLGLLCIVHGKGLHSEGGRGVLSEVTVTALTESGCAACVHAFCTAPVSMGGTGAMLVKLRA